MCLPHKHGKLTITVVYIPPDIRDKDTKDIYYSLLQSAIQNISFHDICIILTATNTTIAPFLHDKKSQLNITGKTCVNPVTNDNEEHLLPFCCNTGLCITDTWYPLMNASTMGPVLVVTEPLGRQLITSLPLIADYNT